MTEHFEHFFVVGVQRSGTTYLYNLLNDHPEIEMAQPLKPEPKFFLLDDLYQMGLDAYYDRFFPQNPAGWLYGEKSTSYMESEKVAERLAQHFPTGKIIMLLRDPVARAISNYWFSHNNGLETESIETAFYNEDLRREHYDKQRISASPYAYLQRGRYIDFIEMYERHIPRERIHIMLHEQLLSDDQTINGLYAFLGVNPAFKPPSAGHAVNQSERGETALSPALLTHLHDYFAKPSARLAAFLGIDLRVWWPSLRDESNRQA